MSYNQKTYKKRRFVKLSKDPLKPPAKPLATKNEKASARSKELTMWRDGWFKGKYESTKR